MCRSSWSRVIGVALMFTMLPFVATAQSSLDNRLFLSLSGAYAIPSDSRSTSRSGGETYINDLELGRGATLLVAAGYGASVGLRGELEIGRRSFSADRVKAVSRSTGEAIGESSFAAQGDWTALSAMVNGIYAFEAGGLRPYFGAGIGMARHELAVAPRGARETDSDTDTTFAYQAMVGVAYPVSESAEVRLGYRYFQTADFELSDPAVGINPASNTSLTFNNHNIEVGIRFQF